MQQVNEADWQALNEKYRGFHDAEIKQVDLTWPSNNKDFQVDLYLDVAGCFDRAPKPLNVQFRLVGMQNWSIKFSSTLRIDYIDNLSVAWQNQLIFVDLAGEDHLDPVPMNMLDSPMLLVCKELLFQACDDCGTELLVRHQ